MAACSVCERSARLAGISNRRKKFLNMKMINLKPVKGALPVAAGYIGGRFISSALRSDNEIGYLSIIAQLLGAGVVATIGGKSGQNAAIGMAMSGILDSIRKFTPGVAQAVGIGNVGYLPTPGSTFHSVAGDIALNGYRVPDEMKVG
jgi:hypothetical protein